MRGLQPHLAFLQCGCFNTTTRTASSSVCLHLHPLMAAWVFTILHYYLHTHKSYICMHLEISNFQRCMHLNFSTGSVPRGITVWSKRSTLELPKGIARTPSKKRADTTALLLHFCSLFNLGQRDWDPQTMGTPPLSGAHGTATPVGSQSTGCHRFAHLDQNSSSLLLFLITEF